MRNKMKKILIAAVCALLALCIICPAIIAIIHSVVMGRYDYDTYFSDRYLTYDDVKSEYPRKTLHFESGENTLSAYLYGEKNNKGLIVAAPGHTDTNDIKLYEIRYFVDAGYQVICFDYTGCYTSGGKAFGGYTQAVYDLDALLDYIKSSDLFTDTDVYLFGHSLGGYAVTAVLAKGHNVQAVYLPRDSIQQRSSGSIPSANTQAFYIPLSNLSTAFL